MEHPPKQGLKRTAHQQPSNLLSHKGFNGTSTKTRIETFAPGCPSGRRVLVLMEHPPKQGLKPTNVPERWYSGRLF